MSEFGESLKNIVMKGIEVIGNKANDLASNAKQKVDEYNLANEQKDLFSSIGSKVFELYSQGAEFPEELKNELKKAAEIGEELERIRAEKEAAAKTAETEVADSYAEMKTSSAVTVDETQTAAVYTAEDDGDIPVLKVEESDEKEEEVFSDCPLSSAINDLFENMPPVDKMMDKVNSSLDELGDNLKKFSGEFSKQLDEFTDQMMGKDNKDPRDHA